MKNAIRESKKTRPGRLRRKGAATVEFAILLPLIMGMAMATIEFGTALNASQKMSEAAKSGARFAAMDWTDKLAEGQSPNEKVIEDVRNFLIAGGIPGDEATITIQHANGNNVGSEFDLSDEANDLGLFRIDIQLPYQSLSLFPNHFFGGSTLHEKIVQRAGRATLSQ